MASLAVESGVFVLVMTEEEAVKLYYELNSYSEIDDLLWGSLKCDHGNVGFQCRKCKEGDK
jgi:hypothetical protein